MEVFVIMHMCMYPFVVMNYTKMYVMIWVLLQEGKTSLSDSDIHF
uniref:Uncharacterized protein n=1 Tax=Anguilla anguilla TaxID=7936 RepID=A0A0E9WKI6_ANGAN